MNILPVQCWAGTKVWKLKNCFALQTACSMHTYYSGVNVHDACSHVLHDTRNQTKHFRWGSCEPQIVCETPSRVVGTSIFKVQWYSLRPPIVPPTLCLSSGEHSSNFLPYFCKFKVKSNSTTGCLASLHICRHVSSPRCVFHYTKKLEFTVKSREVWAVTSDALRAQRHWCWYRWTRQRTSVL